MACSAALLHSFLDRELTLESYHSLAQNGMPLDKLLSETLKEGNCDPSFFEVLSKLLGLPEAVMDFLSIPMIPSKEKIIKMTEQDDLTILIQIASLTELVALNYPVDGSTNHEFFFTLYKGLLQSQHLQIHNKATTILPKIQAHQTLNSHFVNSFLPQLAQSLPQSNWTEVDLRIVTFLINTSHFGVEYFNGCQEAFLRLIDVYRSDDLLVKLNIMELIAELSGTLEGGNFLAERGIHGMLIRDLDSSNAIDEATRISAAVTVAHMLQTTPGLVNHEFANHIPAIKALIEEFLTVPRNELDSVSKWGAGLQLWYPIAHTLEGSDEAILSAIQSELEAPAGNANYSGGAMSAVTAMVTASKHQLSAKLEAFLKQTVVPAVIEIIIRRPFSEFRTPAYNCLSALMDFAFTAEAVGDHKTLIGLLLDHTTDSAFETNKAKHKLRQSMLSSQQDLFAIKLQPAQFTALEDAVLQGPCFVSSGSHEKKVAGITQ